MVLHMHNWKTKKMACVTWNESAFLPKYLGKTCHMWKFFLNPKCCQQTILLIVHCYDWPKTQTVSSSVNVVDVEINRWALCYILTGLKWDINMSQYNKGSCGTGIWRWKGKHVRRLELHRQSILEKNKAGLSR